MIKNEKQYRITKNELKKFKDALEVIENHKNSDVHPLLVKAQRDSLESQIQEFQEDLKEYEKLKSGTIDCLKFDIQDLSKGIISSRIAMGLNHEEFGKLLGLKTQQIQKYESENYRSTSLNRLQEIIEVLGVNVDTRFFLRKSRRCAGTGNFLSPTDVNTRKVSSTIKSRGTIFSICE